MEKSYLNFPYQSFITSKDALELGGYRLEEVFLDDDTDNINQTVENGLRTIAGMIYRALPHWRRDKIYSDASNREALARCQFYQLIYVIENGDLSSRNGVGDVVLNLNDLRGYRNIAPDALAEMTKQGWMYCGVGC